MYCGLNSITNPSLTLRKKATTRTMKYKQIHQMFNKESDDYEFLGIELILLILVHLMCGFDARAVYWS